MVATLSPWLAASRPHWESEVNEWLTTVAKQNNLGKIDSCITLKERPWSLVRRIHFDHGVYTCPEKFRTTSPKAEMTSTRLSRARQNFSGEPHYFKACSRGGQCEPALLHFLKSQSVQNLPDVVAVHVAHKWMLIADSGVTLRDTLTIPEQLKTLGLALSNYAALQIASIDWVDQLLDLGLPDRRLSHLPELLEALLSSSTIGIGHSIGEVETLRTAASNLLPEFEKICTELAKSPYADALDHGDFHTRNLLIKEDVLTVIDWGDACITHPFCSLLVTLESVNDKIAPSEKESQLHYLKDAYLDPWSARYPRDELLHNLDSALWIAHVCRALDFDYMFQGADEETLNQWRPMIFERLWCWTQSCPNHE